LRDLPDHDPQGIDLVALGSRVRPDFTPGDAPWLYEVVRGLEKDGLALVAEKRPEYDIRATDDEKSPDLSAVRVRLP
ncbi:MAG TPA: A/G-specific adenine glycosylase, partial [Methylomirabilota bacterium]|nr:A/G-specific adenine glycosylase [Methylomirabilota bacterium]